MAIAITKPTSQVGNTSNIAAYSLAPMFLPTANSKLVAAALASATVTGSVSGTGATWTLLSSMDDQALGYSCRLWDADISASPNSVAAAFNYTGDNATGCNGAIIQITGQDVGTAPRQVKAVDSVGPNPSVAFDNAIISGNAAVVAILMAGAIAKVTPPAGWTTIAASCGSPAAGIVLAYGNAVSGTTFVFSTGALTGVAYFGAEYYLSGTVPAPSAGNAVPLLMSLFGGYL